MTGYTVHTGSNNKFREGWDKVFKARGARPQSRDGKESAPARKAAKKKSR